MRQAWLNRLWLFFLQDTPDAVEDQAKPYHFMWLVPLAGGLGQLRLALASAASARGGAGAAQAGGRPSGCGISLLLTCCALPL